MNKILRRISIVSFSLILLVSLFACKNSDKDKKDYYIYYRSNGGSFVASLMAKEDSVITAPVNPTKKGFIFDGWYIDAELTTPFTFNKMPSEDTTLYAKWVADENGEEFVIQYHLDGGTNAENPTKFKTTDSIIRLLDPIKDGYTFLGWYDDNTWETRYTTINPSVGKNIELYARWELKEQQETIYNISYNLDGGVNANNPETFTASSLVIDLINPTKDGYTFKGWFTESGFINEVSQIDPKTEKNYTLFAKWEEIKMATTYTITYLTYGGKNGKNPGTYTNESAKIVLESAEKTGCTFKGWYTDSNFTNQITEIDPSSEQNYTLYAKWLEYIQERYFTVDIGLGRTATLFQVSDTHIIDPVTTSDQKSLISWQSQRLDFAKAFGEVIDPNYLTDLSCDMFEKYVNYFNSESAEACVFSGDLMDYYTEANTAFVKAQLARINKPVAYSLGNHEGSRKYYEGINGMPENTSFNVIDLGDYEIVAMDDAQRDSLERYYFTIEQYNLLVEECKKNKPIIIAVHVPILTAYNVDSRLAQCGNSFYIDYYNCDATTVKMIDLMSNNPNIKMILAGHIHGEVVSEFAPGKTLINCTSGLIGRCNKITLL